MQTVLEIRLSLSRKFAIIGDFVRHTFGIKLSSLSSCLSLSLLFFTYFYRFSEDFFLKSEFSTVSFFHIFNRAEKVAPILAALNFSRCWLGLSICLSLEIDFDRLKKLCSK
jgi:hypothetical protein